MDLAFVTTNPGKLREARAILAPHRIRVHGIRRALPEPQADGLDVVVHSKLGALGSMRGPVLVEDSGLFIDSLGGFPGVYSAYIYRIWGLEPILELLRHRPRGATFRTVAGLRVGGRAKLFVGECRGTIAASIRGEHGFGFDPIFIPERSRRTFGEVSDEAKAAVSHRGRALRAVGQYLESFAQN